MYDVIVINARFAGCTTSKVLAEKGYKVFLAEKFRISYMQRQWSRVGGMADTFREME